MANYFSILLVIVTAVTGLIWLADAFLWAPKRKEKVAIALANTNGAVDEQTLKEIAPLPYIVDTAQQIFPVIAFVLVLRSFLYEPFQIPSGSMKSTLLVGDFILVEKFTYGLKDPVARNKFIEVGAPERGDVVVFKYPEDRSKDYIKRVIGMPGDRITYKDKQVTIQSNCENNRCQEEWVADLEYVDNGTFTQMLQVSATEIREFPLERSIEDLGNVKHEILRNPVIPTQSQRFYRQDGQPLGTWVVPEGQYFVLGDNRDNSRDSRYWGFVTDDDLVGKAVAIWISFEFERPSDSILPSWVPSGVRFNRIGGIG
ncbi:signal peptidase I [Alteromonas sp. a30]|uniref:signal peptidase I n=1 Tax=Alteromonas sp. a30 TaxID=2730917 RepID=UPI00227DF1E8|nr:signal peptidase I [Alteromonas sp. a30]MCY7296605.1 signal peptidase I [Alteromonas sp. a30]